VDSNQGGGAHYEYDARGDREDRRHGGRDDRRQGGGGGRDDRHDPRVGNRQGGGGGRDDRRYGGQGGRGNVSREDYDRAMAEKRYSGVATKDLLSKSDNPFQVGRTTDAVTAIVKAVKGIMNKISRDTFNKLSMDLLALSVTSQEMLEKLIDAVFDKALEDVFFQDMYADLCKLLGDKATYWSERYLKVRACAALSSPSHSNLHRRPPRSYCTISTPLLPLGVLHRRRPRWLGVVF
jgi:hypothetical protein